MNGKRLPKRIAEQVRHAAQDRAVPPGMTKVEPVTIRPVEEPISRGNDDDGSHGR